MKTLQTTGQIIDSVEFAQFDSSHPPSSVMDKIFPLGTAVLDEHRPITFSKALPLIADLIRTERGLQVAFRHPKTGFVV